MSQTNPSALLSDDELDGLLRAFFGAERPDPWPVMKAPATTLAFPAPLETRASPTSRRALWRSRLALAASVAVLVGGGLLLPGTPLEGPGPSGPDKPGGAPTADVKERKDLLDGGVPKKPEAPPRGER